MKKSRRKQVRDETFKLLTQEGLTGWRVRFNPRLSRALGRCIPSRKTIEYQTRFIEQNDWDEVVMTIRHEVAHAVSPRGEGHGYTWKMNCLRLGGDGKSYNLTATLSKKFTGTCPGCGREQQRDRRASVSCGKCSGGLYNPAYKIIWTRNS